MKSFLRKSTFVTFIIYMLFIYIFFRISTPAIKKYLLNNVDNQLFKSVINCEIRNIVYISDVNKSLGIDAEDRTDIISYIDLSLSGYINDNTNEISRITKDDFMIDSELTYEKNEKQSDAMQETDFNIISDNESTTDATSVIVQETENQTGNQTENQTGNQTENQTGNQADKQTAKSAAETSNVILNQPYPLKKIKDIPVQQLTFDYLMSKYYTVVSRTTLTSEDMNAEKLMVMDMTMKQNNKLPQILIYHTHGQEGFVDSVPGNPDTGIVGVGSYLSEILKTTYGYNVIHITESYDYVNGVLDRSKAYDYACEGISQILADNPSIEVIIDLHRDGVDEKNHLVTNINGKPTAKIMFFNGISRINGIGEIDYLYNPYRTENLALSLQMKVLSEEYFEGFTRKNYIQAYEYNLHMRPKSMLIEAGAQTNTFQEEVNAMEPLAALLHMVLK